MWSYCTFVISLWLEAKIAMLGFKVTRNFKHRNEFIQVTYADMQQHFIEMFTETPLSQQ